MKIRGYSAPQSLPISSAPGTAGSDEVPKQIETCGGADELEQLLNDPPNPDNDQHCPSTVSSPATTEQLLPVTAETASLSSKVSPTAVNLTVYVNLPPKPMYSKPLPQPPAAPPSDSLSSSSIGSKLMSTSGPDALRNQTDKSDFEIIVEGIPAKLWNDEDEWSLKGLLEEWVPSTQGAFVSADGDQVLDMKRVGTSARCKIHTSLLSMPCFHFRFHFSRTSNEARSSNVN